MNTESNITQNSTNVTALLPLCCSEQGNSESLFLALKTKKDTTVAPCCPIISIKEDREEKRGHNKDNNSIEYKKEYIDKTIENKGATQQHFNPALMLLPFWNLLFLFWLFAQDKGLKWAEGFEKRITIPELKAADFEWLIKAIRFTYGELTPEFQADVKEELLAIIAIDADTDWYATYRAKQLEIKQGTQWKAVIAGQNYQLVRTVRAFSQSEAEPKLCKWPNETVSQWLGRGDRVVVCFKQKVA